MGGTVVSGYGLGRRTAAWLVHGLTASGVLWGLLALNAVFAGDAKACFLWLGVALVVDGIDGTFARKAAVKEVLPWIDGSVLDLVIDYLTYVIVPAAFLAQFGLMPHGLGLAGAGWVLLTSLYCFANVNMKSGDHYFVGFPAIWNVVVLYLWLLEPSVWVNAAVVLALGLLTFSTVTFLHPFRVRKLMGLNIAVTALWLAAGVWLVAEHPSRPLLPFALWLATTAYYCGMCAWRTLKGPDRA
ncbi:phosphatidylcholine synthase [Azospirillum fermentarium]|uniref:CDP-alcohol phosphatidyltransferase family protein n=1 Tax=Azospirillum fermentarium TaxID=1233114 RepID=UPI002227A10A|nr:phosphatidylcholine/phosphatidylserine synthase [Azospirillum fermentarium]MCW2244571.1 phosphatidylcholine synthase [Azospirillum fermentarium]